ncbi:hypothetical protein E2C01_013489 [Portunus trituberculatus]|uniref:Uncharacterized protein n=1 Tax=Portunus trituberculatus TaxID=210409 RepID=A0A5B7DGD7_PORTR|nr:hypothetical protein [Portunus trituberculatus]
MQENIILMTMAAQVTTGGRGKGTPGSLCLQPHIFSSIKLNFCVRVLKNLGISMFKY